ncbi:MAG: hypothetical protein IT529_14135 [Burkholderiales bacterium]|nr:hypothetical protein [Burkholderiales bacterium]
MRQFNVKAWLIALTVALVPCTASAVGLGRLAMLSALGDRLDVEIELVSVSKEELSTLSARLSGPDAYRQANLQYNQALVGARVAIQRRSGGQAYIKITSTRTVNEPFIDLLVEVTSSSGRLVREYTVLVDPPAVGVPPPAVAAAPVAKPVPAPAAQPAAPVPPAPAPAARRPVTPPAAGAKEYGPIQQGENLSRIARSVIHEGVSLEQMMVGLYRSNPDAFIRNNLNLVKAGRILRVPDREAVAQIAPAEARKEFRAQVADWNAYRQGLAGAAGTARAEGRTTAAGRITPRVEDKAGSEPKDVVKLSRGEPPVDAKGKPRSSAERVRALEEEVLARDKALNEATERIGQLEKTIKDMQRLAELKSPAMAAAQQKAEEAAKAKAGAAAKPAPEPKAGAKPEPKPEVVAAAKPEDAKAAPATDAKAAAKAEAPKADAAPAPKAKPKVVAAPPPPSMMDQVVDAATDPLYLGAGGGVIALGGLAFWMARRRRSQGVAAEEPQRAAPVLGGATGIGAPLGPESTVSMPAMAAVAAAPVAAAADDVDPLAEAEVYIAYGRDAQAEEILKEALAKNPGREDAQLKLLEIYSARKDKNAFNGVAGDLHKRTGGAGDKWLAAAAMGYALDPANALYEAGRDAAGAVPAAGTTTGGDLDFDLGGDTAGVATDIMLDSGAVQAATAHDTTAVLDAAELRSMAAGAPKEPEPTAAPLMPDFTLDLPVSASGEDVVTKTDISLDAVPTQDGHVIDFQIELPKVDAPEEKTQVLAEAPATDAGLDFKLDVPDLDLGEPKAAAAGAEKDGHWYDVQTKFDLAKAYQEMGDKVGAREILQEVIKEGDSEQQAQAKGLLDTLT